MKAFLVFFWLAVGAFVYQWVQAEPNYVAAVERSYFQGVALFTYWVLDSFIWRDK